MNALFFKIKQFFIFYLKAKNRYKIDSPFAYEFISTVFDSSKVYYQFGNLESCREKLLLDPSKIIVEDLGASSQKIKGKERQIKNIAKTSLSPPWFCKMLFRLVVTQKPRVVLELGTSLGLSAAYMASVSKKSNLISIEGSTEIAKEAKKLISGLKLKNVTILTGSFDLILETILIENNIIDLAFIDGNHQKEATLRYFHLLKNHIQNDSILIFDDIYWSSEMTAAWELIKNDESVRLTIDIYKMGIVFFKKEFKVKQHIKYVPFWFKPWMIGLFR